MKKTYKFIVIDDYRSGRYVKHECVDDINSQDESYYEDSDWFDITIKHPSSGYKLFIIHGYYSYCIVWKKHYNTKEKAKKALLKIFTQYNNSMPFVVTGMTCSYKETGHYPEIPDDIKKMKNIKIPQLCADEQYFMVIVNNKKIIKEEMLHPY